VNELPTFDLTLFPGETRAFEVTLTDLDGIAIDPTGRTLVLSFFRRKDRSAIRRFPVPCTGLVTRYVLDGADTEAIVAAARQVTVDCELYFAAGEDAVPVAIGTVSYVLRSSRALSTGAADPGEDLISVALGAGSVEIKARGVPGLAIWQAVTKPDGTPYIDADDYDATNKAPAEEAAAAAETIVAGKVAEVDDKLDAADAKLVQVETARTDTIAATGNANTKAALAAEKAALADLKAGLAEIARAAAETAVAQTVAAIAAAGQAPSAAGVEAFRKRVEGLTSTDQSADPAPFVAPITDINDVLIARGRDPTTGLLDDTLTLAAAKRVGAQLGVDFADAVATTDQSADPAPFVNALTDVNGRTLYAMTWAGKLVFDPTDALVAAIGRVYTDPATVSGYTGSAVLAQAPFGAVTLESWDTFAHAALVTSTTRAIITPVRALAAVYSGQSQGGPAGTKATVDALAPTLCWMPNGGNQYPATAAFNGAVSAANLVPARDADSAGGQGPATLLSIALTAQQRDAGETVTGMLAASSYYGGQSIKTFRPDATAADDGTSPNFFWANTQALAGKLISLAPSIGRKSILIAWPMFQGENYTTGWEADATTICDAQAAVQQAINAADGVAWRPPSIIGQTHDLRHVTTPSGAGAEQRSLARKHYPSINGAGPTTAMASQAMIVPCYPFSIKNDENTHYDWRGNFMRAETTAWMIRRFLNNLKRAGYDYASSTATPDAALKAAVVPALDLDHIDYVEGATTLRAYLINPTAIASTVGGGPGFTNIPAHPGNPIYAERDWLGRWALPPNEGFGLEGAGGVTITSVTPGGFANNWIDIGLSGPLPAGTGTRTLTYGYTPTVIASGVQPVNWSSTRGTICIDTGHLSWFRQQPALLTRMGSHVIPERVRLYLMRFKESF